jgi:L-alanine-DL-glutamate epimerase-like enolase superfamily enzyme
VADSLLGHDPRDIERIWADLYRAFDFQIAGGAEIRALSAIDLALWDLLGKHLGAPVYRLIGGKANPRVRLYNTCFPYKYDFNREPEKIMRELIDTRGIKAIKIWPFDGAAARNRNQFITPQDIDEALQPVRKLRDAFGSDIEIAIEFHAQWNVTSAIRIAHALEPYRPMWLEDMLMPGNYLQYRELAAATSLPLIAGERMAGKLQFEQLLESRAVKYVMFDLTWCGGLTEARKIAGMADAFELPIAPHTAGRCCSTPPPTFRPRRLTCGSKRAASGFTSATGRPCWKTPSLRRLDPYACPRKAASVCGSSRKPGITLPPSAR